MSEAQARPQWARLGAELQGLRDFAGKTQRDIAAALKISQTSVDRIENGGPQGKPPSWPKVEAWAAECASANPDMVQLRALTQAALDEHALFRNMLQPGLASIQEDIREEEAAAREQSLFNPWGVPGLLQTAEYAHRVLLLADYRRAGGIDEAVRARLRRQEVLDKPGYHFGFVLTEAGLRWRPGPLPVLTAQLEHLAGMAALPAVSLSVIPLGVLAHAIPRCGFVLYEDLADGGEPFAAIEIDHKRVIADKAADVEIYRAQYDLLQRSAVTGDEAVAFIGEVAQSL